MFQPSPLLTLPSYDGDSVIVAKSDWQVEQSEEHPFVQDVRGAVLKYRLQSAAHFGISIDVHQTRFAQNPSRLKQLTSKFKIIVGFHHFGRNPILCICRPKFWNNTRGYSRMLIAELGVGDRNQYMLLSDFLATRFPTFTVPVRGFTLQAWWEENGKTFNWNAVPTELKEIIIQFCMHQSRPCMLLSPKRRSMKSQINRRRSPFEITDQLSGWVSLLRVSHQVREITLRLCFVGGSSLAYDKGLCVDTRSYSEFTTRISRLSKYYQVVRPDSVPIGEPAEALARTYKQYPKLYPHLRQYATFRHAIRKISIEMDFLDYLRFFKVTTAGFEKYWRANHVNFEVFEQLPSMNELVIVLPDFRGRLEDDVRQDGPQLFFAGFECPRLLHCIIYNQAAKLLAAYANVKMRGFIDESEKLRFEMLRNAAVKALKFTQEDFEELYVDDNGGVELENVVYPGRRMEETEGTPKETQLSDEELMFWPPKCMCEIRCRRFIAENGSGLS